MTHVEKANDLFAKKFHCSQAVFAAFAEELGLTEEQALKIGACFGSGMRKGEVCGACTGALMAIGLKYGQCNVQDMDSRMKTNEVTDKVGSAATIPVKMVSNAVKDDSRVSLSVNKEAMSMNKKYYDEEMRGKALKSELSAAEAERQRLLEKLNR